MSSLQNTISCVYVVCCVYCIYSYVWNICTWYVCACHFPSLFRWCGVLCRVLPCWHCILYIYSILFHAMPIRLLAPWHCVVMCWVVSICGTLISCRTAIYARTHRQRQRKGATHAHQCVAVEEASHKTGDGKTTEIRIRYVYASECVCASILQPKPTFNYIQ